MSIALTNIYHTYSKGTPFERLALQDVSLEIAKGEIVAVIGHTGSGKSTLVQHLNGLLKPDKGQAAIDGVNINAKGTQAKAARQQVGMVFQYPEHQIFAETVFEDIAFGPRNKGFNEDEVAKQVREAMAFVGLDYDTFAQRSPFQLSGGQMRRVAIAGVVAMNPDYLVLDEPSAGLDPRSRNAVFREIMALHKSRGIAIVLVTHSMEEAVKYADRLLVINGGKVLFDGQPAAIFKEHGAELVQVGVDVPQVYKLAALLRQQGLELPEGIKDEAALIKAIKKAKGWK
ncbi:MAG: energy-coupling factor transporter ATPase [Phascolarctobacterium sp.]|uniref:energy-coupling factor transporter ATPase n=1 Tax=Phascolarctobacterium sp. TaxID=2049039 RepID=UPI0026DAFDAF|nr:energy-coupling factor transporter ATPase [Phascolarctobacterium sp.]MDO4921895.1 energy-coupling factor transporter ATPase [Phascolarctobacterium sp.]